MPVVCAGKCLSEDERVKIFTEDGEYEGIVKSAGNNNLVLQQVKSITANIAYKGYQIFLVSEIVQAEILGSSIKESSSCNGIKKNDPNSTNGSNALRFVLQLKENEKRKLNESESQVSDVAEESCLVFINALDHYFCDAINYIKSSKTIGVATEGINVGRNGDLCLLQIDTEKTVFIFDMVEMGKEFFRNGLAEIMISPNILKIFHNCREFSGLLALHYNIKLQNVFDTQVADVMIFKTQSSYFPKFVCSLPTCLVNVLGLDNDDVNCLTIREGQEKEDLLVWRKRPLPLRCVDAAIKDVVHLRRLHTALLEELHSEITRGTEIYLNAYKTVSVSCQEHLLPTQFANLRNLQQKPKRRLKDKMLRFDESEFVLNRIKNHDWRLRFHRDACHMERNPEIPKCDEEDIVGVIKNAKDINPVDKKQNQRQQTAGRDRNRTRSQCVSRLNLKEESENNDTKNSQKSVKDEDKNSNDRKSNSNDQKINSNDQKSNLNDQKSNSKRRSGSNRRRSGSNRRRSGSNRRRSGSNRRRSSSNRRRSFPVPTKEEVIPVKETIPKNTSHKSQYSNFTREMSLKDRNGILVKLG